MFILLCSFGFFVIWDSIQLVDPFVLLVLHSTCQPPPPLQRMPPPCARANLLCALHSSQGQLRCQLFIFIKKNIINKLALNGTFIKSEALSHFTLLKKEHCFCTVQCFWIKYCFVIALAATSRPWHLTTALGWQAFSEKSYHCWAPSISQAQSTGLPSIFLRAQPWTFIENAER